MPRLLTGTFTTAAFARSSFRQFEASPYRAAPKALPSSFAQPGAIRAFLTQHRPSFATVDSFQNSLACVARRSDECRDRAERGTKENDYADVYD